MPERSGTFFVQGEKIVLKKDGTWIADGIEITHEQTKELFYRAIQWNSDRQKYCLSVGYETIFIEVEDTPFFVTAIEQSSEHVRLSNQSQVSLRADKLFFNNGNLYLELESGQRAKFLSAAYYEILKGLEEDENHYFLTIAGARANLLPKRPASRALPPGGQE